MKTISIKTNKRCDMVDITREVNECVKESGIISGIVHIFIPHTTAGVSINENVDPDVKRDVLYAMERAVPNSGFRHIEGNSDAHTKAQMTGFSLNVFVEDAKLMLGTWQSVYFYEYDGPRARKVFVKIVKSED
ncbi:MAG: secondary thiamine-phosphate synthase enzyme YjbQ [Eubacteriales bacterium]|nr:secondary thiamine-phosphate synthase enzyme YjbQ [Eubacteriales bacterium]